MIDKWDFIAGFENNYLISSNGDIVGVRRNITLKPTMTSSGLVVNLSLNGVQVRKYIHRLVYETFAGMLSGHIKFKDGDKTNCWIGNLVKK